MKTIRQRLESSRRDLHNALLLHRFWNPSSKTGGKKGPGKKQPRSLTSIFSFKICRHFLLIFFSEHLFFEFDRLFFDECSPNLDQLFFRDFSKMQQSFSLFRYNFSSYRWVWGVSGIDAGGVWCMYQLPWNHPSPPTSNFIPELPRQRKTKFMQKLVPRPFFAAASAAVSKMG